MCHLSEAQGRKRRKKKNNAKDEVVNVQIKKYNEYKTQEALGRGSKQNCSSAAALCHRAKGEALTEEGPEDGMACARLEEAWGAHERLQEPVSVREEGKMTLRTDTNGQTQVSLSSASSSCPLQQAAAKLGEAVTIIANQLFPQLWLLNYLISSFTEAIRSQMILASLLFFSCTNISYLRQQLWTEATKKTLDKFYSRVTQALPFIFLHSCLYRCKSVFNSFLDRIK